MADYIPERWLIVKVEPLGGEAFYRVFGTWGGSYLQGQSWKINSGIKSVKYDDGWYEFLGASGSVYQCHEKSYGSFSYGQSVLNNFIERSKEQASITIMDENTNWLELKYE